MSDGLAWTAFAALLGFVTSAVGTAFGALDTFVIFNMPDGMRVSALDALIGFSVLYLLVDFLTSIDAVGDVER